LGSFGEPTGAPKGAQGTYFKPLWGDKWKCENYAPVEAESSLLRLEGVLRELICSTSGPLVLSMHLRTDFLEKLVDFDSPRGPCGFPFGALLAYFWAPLSGSDFRLILGMLLGGAGGRGGVPVASESLESESLGPCLHTPGSPCGGAANLKASPLPAGPLGDLLVG
jgi:hypothetical protein